MSTTEKLEKLKGLSNPETECYPNLSFEIDEWWFRWMINLSDEQDAFVSKYECHAHDLEDCINEAYWWYCETFE